MQNGTLVATLRQNAQLLTRLAVLMGTALVAGTLFQIKTHVFFNGGNLQSILLFMTSVAIVGYGMTIIVVAGELDLSVGSTYGLASMSAALMWKGGMHFLLAAFLGVLVGALAGLINGLIVTKLRVNSFIATLGTLNLYGGITLWISHNVAMSPGNELPGFKIYEFIGTSSPFGLPIQIYWLIIFSPIMWFILHRSLFGFRVAAIGGNKVAAESARMPVTRIKLYAFTLTGALAGVAGIIDFSLVSSVSPTAGSTVMFSVLAAVIIGGAALSGGRGTIIGTVAGVFLLAVLTNGLGLLGAGAFAQLVFQGAVILIAISTDSLVSRKRQNSEVQM
jgi:ribose/xylose/arabinose/galactoside ABC-type transport system permease subunit